MRFCSAYHSDIGIKKETNQDALLLLQQRQPSGDEIVFAVICDGVGGLAMGEKASAAVVKAFRAWFHQSISTIYQMENPTPKLYSDWEELVQAQHLQLKAESEQAGFRCGTTVEAVLLMKERYYICHVGDCRTYLVADSLVQLTTDHTIVQRELDEGILTEEQAQKDSRQNLLLQCVGAGKAVKPDYLQGEFGPQQAFLICCDGFRRRVKVDEIQKICKYSTKEKKLRGSLETITELCKKRREPDNITGILIGAAKEARFVFPFRQVQTEPKMLKDILLVHDDQPK